MNFFKTMYLSSKNISSFHLKILAVILMTIDHIGVFTGIFVFRQIGRLSFPLFAFLIAFGERKTSNKFNYFKRLLLFGIIIELFFFILSLFFNIVSKPSFNIFITLAIGLLSIILYKKDKINGLYFLVITFVLIELEPFGFDYFSKVEYGFYGVLLIFLFQFEFYTSLILTSLLHLTQPYYQILAIFSGLIILFFNSDIEVKSNRNTKYFFYLYYPVHLLLLGIIFNYLL